MAVLRGSVPRGCVSDAELRSLGRDTPMRVPLRLRRPRVPGWSRTASMERRWSADLVALSAICRNSRNKIRRALAILLR